MNYKENDKILMVVKYLRTKHNIKYHLEIQMILYLLSLNYFKEKDKLLFNDSFQAWSNSPIQTKLFRITLDTKTDSDDEEFWNEISDLSSKETKNFIDQDIKKYEHLNILNLIELTRLTLVWGMARQSVGNNEDAHPWIHKEDFKKYAKSNDYDDFHYFFE